MSPLPEPRTMAALDWGLLRAMAAADISQPGVLVLAPVGKNYTEVRYSSHYSVDNAAVKAVLTGPLVPCERCNGIGMFEEDGNLIQCPVCFGACSVAPSIPGADLIVGKNTLQVR